MILLFAFFLALLWGFLQGGRLSKVQDFSLRGYGIVLASFAVQLVVIYGRLPTFGDNILRESLLILAYAILGVFLWWNRQLPGMWLISIGFLANWTVIIANGGYMPITFEALTAAGLGHAVTGAAPGTLVLGSKDLLLPTEMTNLAFLSDIFVISRPFPIPSVFSIGDAFIAFGLFWLVPHALGAPPLSLSRRRLSDEASS